MPTRHKILIVDDEPKILNSLVRRLGTYYDISTANSGRDGLKILQEHSPFAVVVADYLMPGMNGVEFLSRIKKKYATVRIMLTGYPELKIAEKAVDKGDVFLFLTKPCSSYDLREAIDSGLREYKRNKGADKVQPQSSRLR